MRSTAARLHLQPNSDRDAAGSPGSGSQEPFVALYRIYGAAIYARCRRILEDDAAAEDATQETFVRVYRHLARAPKPDEALYWINRIATNYCLNEVRNRKLRPLPVAAVPERTADGALDERIADRQLVRLTLDHVPEKLRTVAWLHHIDGLDQAEAAKALDLSLRTVAARLAAFRDRVRKLVG